MLDGRGVDVLTRDVAISILAILRYQKVYTMLDGYVPGIYYTWSNFEFSVKGFAGLSIKILDHWKKLMSGWNQGGGGNRFSGHLVKLMKSLLYTNVCGKRDLVRRFACYLSKGMNMIWIIFLSNFSIT